MKEFDIIRRLLRPLSRSESAAGLADDVSMLPISDCPLIVTTDTLVEHVHFNSSDPLYSVGKKLVRVNVSDCLAKAAQPRFALFNLTWPHSRGDDELEALIQGLSDDFQYFGIDLIGGDTTSSRNDIVLSLTLFGECVRNEGPVRRSGAQPDDDIWVSGSIGDGFLGLKARHSSDLGNQLRKAELHYLVPQIPDRTIAECIGRFASGSIDVSDGLIADARHLSDASGVQLVISADKVPFSDEARHVVTTAGLGISLSDLISGGDDYQCLFTAPQKFREEIESFKEVYDLTLTRIGDVRSGAGVLAMDRSGKVFKALNSGWEHGKTL